MWQEIVVAALVIAAALAALWRLLPVRWRGRVAQLHPALDFLAAPKGGCGGCSGCPASQSGCTSAHKLYERK